jgi:hypothetical protein
MLEALENIIRTSPPPSPQQSSSKMSRSTSSISYAPLAPQHITPPSTSHEADVDEYGFAYDDYEDEDDSLSLTKTISRRS